MFVNGNNYTKGKNKNYGYCWASKVYQICVLYPTPYRKIIREFPISIVLMPTSVLINVEMLVITKKNTTNLFDYVDYQNAGPKINFLSVFTYARD